MAIYTRKGDAGMTRLADGSRVSKLHCRIEAVGAVDELSSALGLARGLTREPATDAALSRIQAQLIKIGSALSSPKYGAEISPDWVKELERAINEAEAELPRQTDWVLPGDTPGAGALHFARSVCRRAERAALKVYLDEEGTGTPEAPEAEPILAYLNRLSDYLHVLGRLESHRHLVRGIAQRVAHGLREDGANAGSPKGPLTTADCDRMLAAAEERAHAIGVPMVIAVVDEGGNLKAFRRMDGALLASVQIAQGKAYTSAALRLPTREVGAQVQPGAPLYGIALAAPGKMITFAGGLPLWRGERLIGAIGVSGGTVEEDEEVALAGQQALADCGA